MDGHSIEEGVSIKAWLLALHNDVNRRKGVPAWTPDMVTATVGAVRRRELDVLISLIMGKIGDAAYQILRKMIDRVAV
jgi:hypothetical protein